MTYICISKLFIIGSYNGLSPDRHQAIIWTNDGMLLIGPLGTNFSEIWIKIQTFHSRKCVWKCRLWNGGHFVYLLYMMVCLMVWTGLLNLQVYVIQPQWVCWYRPRLFAFHPGYTLLYSEVPPNFIGSLRPFWMMSSGAHCRRVILNEWKAGKIGRG